MEARHAFALLVTGGIIGVASVHCSSPDTVALGSPNALVGRAPPAAFGDNPNAGDGGGGGDNLNQICNGGPPIDGGTCAVSFQTTILGKYMSAGGTWKCADAGCHGGKTPLNQPGIDPSMAQATWDNLRLQIVSVTGNTPPNTPYINPCSTDPTKSSIVCSIDPTVTPTCGDSMPQVGGAVLATRPVTAEIADLKTWLSCGAPFN